MTVEKLMTAIPKAPDKTVYCIWFVESKLAADVFNPLTIEKGVAVAEYEPDELTVEE